MNLCFTDISANKVGILSVSCFFAVNLTKRIKKGGIDFKFAPIEISCQKFPSVW